MTLLDMQTYIYRRTQTDATSFANASMVVEMNAANEHVLSLIRGYADTFYPTAWTTTVLSTGTATPVFDSLFHELIPLWVVYYHTNDTEIRSGVFNEIQLKEHDLLRFYSLRHFQPLTVTVATPAVFTLVDNDLCLGDQVIFSTTGALPTGLTVGTYYYISAFYGDGTFQVSTSRYTSSTVNTSGSQSGTHYISRIANPRMTPKRTLYI